MARRKLACADRLPSPHQIAQNPELALLAVLASILEATAVATITAWPELTDLEPRPMGADAHILRHANSIIRQAHRLGGTVHRYRAALADFLEAKAKADHPEDTPF